MSMTRLAPLAVLTLIAAPALAADVIPSGEEPDITVCSRGCDYTSIQRAVNAAAPGDTIALGPETFKGGISINKRPLTIQGAGAHRTIIEGSSHGTAISAYGDGVGPVRLLDMTIQNAPNGGVYGRDVEIERCVIQGNHAKGPWSVGGVEIWSGSVRDSVIRNNRAEGEECPRPYYCPSAAGGIFAASVTVERTLIENNQGEYAGGMMASFDAVITQTTIEGNRGELVGGAFVFYGVDVVVGSSTIRDNTGEFAGGLASDAYTLTIDSVEISDNAGECGLWVSDGTIRGATIADNEGHGVCLKRTTVVNSTVSGNQGDGIRGLYMSNATAEFRIDSSTVVDNLGVGVATQSPAHGVIYNTIVANNGGFQCDFSAGELVSQGHNVSSDLSCPFWEYGDIESTDPLLLPLARYGGPTRTHLPEPGSPVIDAGGDICPQVDQRGRPRPLDGDRDGHPVCDIGSVEFVPYDFEIIGPGGVVIVFPADGED